MYQLVEAALVLVSFAALGGGAAQLIDAVRSRATASAGSRIHLLVAQMGVRAGIARCVSSIALLAVGLILLRVPNDEMDYPALIQGASLLFLAMAALLLLFSLRDMRDKRLIVELLRQGA